jgi:hypothetical protein
MAGERLTTDACNFNNYKADEVLRRHGIRQATSVPDIGTKLRMCLVKAE